MRVASMRRLSEGSVRSAFQPRRRVHHDRRMMPKGLRGINVGEQSLLVPLPAHQQVRVAVDDRIDWRPVANEAIGVPLGSLIQEELQWPSSVAAPLFRSRQILVRTARGAIRPASAGHRLAQDEMIGVPKVLPDHLYRRLTGETPPRRKLSAAEIEKVRSWVLFKSEHCIVLNKPPGVPTASGFGSGLCLDDLLDGLKFTTDERPAIMNRMDTDTSGCVVLARTSAGRQWMKRYLFVPRAPSFTYWACVRGKPAMKQARMQMQLDRMANESGADKVIIRQSPTNTSVSSVLEFSTVSTRQSCSWVAFYPLKLVKDQLRIAAAAVLKTPILGDGKYGGDAAFPYQEMGEVWDGLKNQPPLHLHCRQVSLPFENSQQRRIVIQAPMPQHMTVAWHWLGWDPNYSDPYIDV
eukprot:TRINITY_DN16662_c2_g1_i1.p1 TRINITY_DN16662_c2_g1~~TRINITY_DN16662_c2_g1_i1.p1  ORF type:complete len:454 (+),score=49.12 TRINITY_DN16662_c2_g1_i1:141-1364(+)